MANGKDILALWSTELDGRQIVVMSKIKRPLEEMEKVLEAYKNGTWEDQEDIWIHEEWVGWSEEC